ncbi:MAG TPA: hypothetical protein PK514_02200 [Spirochaetota bacterium]|nr:hypothetical protein [Spirochaetota bacterium]
MKLFFLIIKFAAVVAILAGCNPVSENITEKLWSSLHSSKPFQSDYYHGAVYRFPHGNCDEVQCHGNDLTGGNSGAPSCYTCHGDTWTIFSTTHFSNRGGFYHHIAVDDYPADRTVNTGWFNTCKYASCHGSTLDGVTSAGYSCKICHSGFSGLIPPPGHSNSEEGNWHHYNIERSKITYCSGDACHGADGESGGSAVSGFTGLTGHGQACDTCHD